MSSSRTLFNVLPYEKTSPPSPDQADPVVIPAFLPSQDVPDLPSSVVYQTDCSKIFKLPKLRLQFADLGHKASTIFLTCMENPAKLVHKACFNVLLYLYEAPDSRGSVVPPTRSVTIILRSMGGVAYTTGMELDNDHKEIHLSLDYIAKVDSTRVRDEIEGVITHELVHCLQYTNGCPEGLVEGVADWVRLRCGLAPPHWKRDVSGKWNRGYQNTAFFLQYLEDRFGSGTVQMLNDKLRVERYEECTFWTDLVGWPIDRLWEDYRTEFKECE